MIKRLFLALGLIAIPAVAAPADAAAPGPACSVVDSLLTQQDPNMVTIGCKGVSPEFAGQLAALMNTLLRRRLDPQLVGDKLADLEPVTGAGVARNFSLAQRQIVIQALYGKPPGQVAIVADPTESDAPGYATDIATALQMVGWQIAGNQITRKTVPALVGTRGIAVAVRNAAAPPPIAVALKAALQAANIETPIRSDPALAADATMLWIGKRPSFTPAAGPKS
ncbi:MAG: hypothetical protein ACREFB_03350 [Stellaceae bacterium]